MAYVTPVSKVLVKSYKINKILGKPEVKYVANMHGNEVVGREMLLILARYLCENYGSDERVTHIVKSMRTHLLPSLNPDGYEVSHEGILFRIS